MKSLKNTKNRWLGKIKYLELIIYRNGNFAFTLRTEDKVVNPLALTTQFIIF